MERGEMTRGREDKLRKWEVIDRVNYIGWESRCKVEAATGVRERVVAMSNEGEVEVANMSGYKKCNKMLSQNIWEDNFIPSCYKQNVVSS